ncbi:hypothetical protein, partial [Streptomyces sp. NPDC094468]|uniref:hypothetical protein n=1 Tax=Streptomyces sp. NPDC094468 TaxID=3366066 RepID=UPI00382B9085
MRQLGVAAFEASLANASRGLPPVSIEITGHSNGIQGVVPNYGFAKEHGLARANAVAGYIRRGLSSHPRAVEAHAMGVFNPSLIQITPRTAGNDLPDGSSPDDNPVLARRRVVIWVDVPIIADLTSGDRQRQVLDDSAAHRPSQEEIETENEIQRLKDEIHEEFGITLDSEKGARAAVEGAKNTDPDVIAAVRPAPWTVRKVKNIITALKHYKPILGKERDTSSRSGIEQEVNTIGNLTWIQHPMTGEIEPNIVGRHIGAYKTVNLATYAYGTVNHLHETVAHELAHGLLSYSEPQFDAEFWTGLERPILFASTPSVDFVYAIAAHLAFPVEFKEKSPRYAAVMAMLARSRPDVMTLGPNEDTDTAAARIANELRSDLPWFAKSVGTWRANGQPQIFFPRERPISKYGETDSKEDLAETAAIYFTDIDRLRSGAPLRAEFMDRLVEGWKQRRE